MMNLSGPRYTYAVVQIQAFRMKHLETANYDDLTSMVPCHDHWDNLVETMPADDAHDILSNNHDVFLTEDVVGLYFSSVGDWPGYGSFFQHEVDNLSIDEVVEPYREAIMRDVEFGDKDETSILTLWEGCSSCDYFGEWDFEFDYLGVMKNLKAAL